jgi:hypothetical protein
MWLNRSRRHRKSIQENHRKMRFFWITLIFLVLAVDAEVIRSHRKSLDLHSLPMLHPSVQTVTENGGVGDSFAHIEQVYGVGVAIPPARNDANVADTYQNGHLIVTYAQHRVMNLTLTLSHHIPRMTIAQAETFGRGLLPIDAEEVMQFSPDKQTLMVVFQSKTLIPLFAPLWSTDNNGQAHPDRCALEIIHTGNEVNSLTALLGQSP